MTSLDAFRQIDGVLVLALEDLVELPGTRGGVGLELSFSPPLSIR